MRDLGSVGALVLALVGLEGCSKKQTPPPMPETLEYEIQLDEALVGVDVIVAGQHATLEKGTEDEHQWPIAKARVKLARSGPSALDGAALDLKTPCGPRSIALTMREGNGDEDQRRKNPYASLMVLHATPAAKPPPALGIAVDGDKDTKVTIGTTGVGDGQTLLFDARCTPKIVVRSAGRELGAIDTSSSEYARARGLLVAPKDDVCYAYVGASYGMGSSSRSILRGAHVYPLVSAHVDYFRKAAPGSMRSENFVIEIQAVGCPTRD